MEQNDSISAAYARLPDESFEDYFVRICENKNVYGLTFTQVADILNAENGKTFSESAYRKKWKNFQNGRLYERKRIGKNMLVEQTRELEKQRIRIADERAALKRLIREEARIDALMDEIRSEVQNYEPLEDLSIIPVEPRSVDGTLVVMLSDLHIGVEFDNTVGCYNSDIAVDRLQQYVTAVKEAAIQHTPKHGIVLLGGDMISGVIHTQLRVENREPLVRQLKLASEMIANFINEIALCFETVDVYGVGGNHSRVIDKDNSMLGEMLDNIIPVYLSARLESASRNIVIHESKENKALEHFFIENNSCVLVHGDFDDLSPANIGRIERMVQGVVDCIFVGHLHENDFHDESGVHIFRSGCLSGSGDEYCLKKRLSGQPAQMMVYFNGKGMLKNVLPVYFD